MKLLDMQHCRNLDDQGYTFLSLEEKSKLNIALRITPTLCILAVIIGVVLQNFWIFAVLAIFGILGAATKRYQPFDVLYNVLLRHVLKTPKLPPSPPQKRFACGIGALFLAGAAISVYFGYPLWLFIFAACYILAAGIMAATHWCIGSWIYNHLFTKKAPAEAK